MALEDFLIIVGIVFIVVCYIGYRHGTENVYVKYKEQRVGPFKTKEGKK